jgi:hypothetical protein
VGQAAAISTDSPIAAIERGPIRDSTLVGELTDRLEDFVVRLQSRLGDAEGPDPGSESAIPG